MEQIKIQEASRQREATQRAPNSETVRFIDILVSLIFFQGASGQIQQSTNMARGPAQSTSAHGLQQQFPPQAQSVPQPSQGMKPREVSK